MTLGTFEDGVNQVKIPRRRQSVLVLQSFDPKKFTL